ncbi:styrene monooxygenase/indole monooxygenase family protein [Amycolatopsis sp. NPDC059657]|uniref:styrene monooxygenase/indole monooxygenase family protein n=1 Tax=Amycolatopsis sp. NPDC059657 TaxID=3346899 RepID=UPI00366CC7CD
MRRIGIIGAGQAGLLLALGLQQQGYETTVITDRDATAILGGRVLSNQCVFEPALRHERALGVNFWDGTAPEIAGVSFTSGPITWKTPLDRPAQSVDQRLKMSDWLADFADLGGAVRLHKVTPADLESYAREFDLVLVAAGRGPQFDALFVRDNEFSPYSEPQRAISMMYVDGISDRVYPGVDFSLGPEGEYFALPVLTATGPAYGMYFSGIPGGPLDCWDDVADIDHHFEVAARLLAEFFPWAKELLDHATPNGPLDHLHGRITPIVRDPIGRLPSGALVLAMGDTAITNDPIAGQGANLAAHCAAVYQARIIEQGDAPFDEAFMRRSFADFWPLARVTTRFSNDLLAPPPPHVLATLETAQSVPAVAHRFAHLFDDPSDYEGWLTDEAEASRYLRSFA